MVCYKYLAINILVVHFTLTIYISLVAISCDRDRPKYLRPPSEVAHITRQHNHPKSLFLTPY